MPATTPETIAQPSRADPPDGLRSVLAAPHVPRLLLGSLIGRLPVAAAPLAIMLCAVAGGSSYTSASIVAGLYGLAATVGQPALGRLVDSRGARLPLRISAVITGTALALLSGLDQRTPLLPAAAAVVAGLATPPLEGALRALWYRTVPERLQPAAFALDVASQSLLFALGPLLVAALAQIARPGVALATTGLVGLLGTWAMTSAEPCREAHGSRRRPDWYGPLRSAELRGMAFVLALVGVALGAQSVAGTAWAEGINRPASAGLLLGAFSAGSFVGGLLFSRCARPAGNRTLALLLCTFAIGWIPLALAPASLPLMTCLAIVPGLTLSPLLGTVFDRVGRSADPGLVTETFSWLVSAVGVGSAAGTAIAGLIADHKGASFAYAFAATSAAGAMGRLAVHLTSIARPREWRAVLPDTPGGSIRNNRSVIPWRHPINPVN